MELWIRAYGRPVPQGSKVAKVVGNRAVMWEANPALRDWRETVRLAAWRAADGMNFDQPVSVTCWFYIPRPKSVKRRRPSVKPDIDKLCRSVLDACSDIWSDDALVVELSAAKHYADDVKEGVQIHIRTLET